LNVSLIVECAGSPFDKSLFNHKAWLAALPHYLNAGLKIAGGDLLAFAKPELIPVDEAKELSYLMRRLMPGYALIERRDLMIDAMQNGADAINALPAYLKEHRSQLADNGQVEWCTQRKTDGWIVPIATGFHGISELGIAENQHDPDTLHRFAESLVTLGEFVMAVLVRGGVFGESGKD